MGVIFVGLNIFSRYLLLLRHWYCYQVNRELSGELSSAIVIGWKILLGAEWG